MLHRVQARPLARPLAASLLGSEYDPDLVAYWNFSRSLMDMVTRDRCGFVRSSPATFVRGGKRRIAAVNEPRMVDDGLLIAGAGANKCQCVKYNPQDTTGVTNASVVDASASLAGTEIEDFGPNVYQTDGTGAATGSFISGQSGNTNAHSVSLYARLKTVGVNNSRVAIDATIVGYITSTEWTHFRFPATAAPNNTAKMCVTAAFGDVVEWTLPQFEESTRCSEPIIGDNSAAAAARATEGGGLTFALPAALSGLLASSGSMYIEHDLLFGSEALSGYTGIVSTIGSAGSLLFWANTSTSVQSTDGSVYPPISGISFSAGDTAKQALTWLAGDKFYHTFDDNLSLQTPFDGAFASTGSLRLYVGCPSNAAYVLKRLWFSRRTYTGAQLLELTS